MFVGPQPLVRLAPLWVFRSMYWGSEKEREKERILGISPSGVATPRLYVIR